MEFVEVLKIDTERYFILEELIGIDLKSINSFNGPIKISLNLSKMEAKLKSLLLERKMNPLDIPNYKGRFKEEDIFIEMKVLDENLRLCNTGFDNKIIFVTNLYNSIERNDETHYLFFARNHKEYRDWKLSQEQ